MTIQEMQKKKTEIGITYAEIARRAGIPLPTVQKVLSGKTKSPRYETILALEKVLSSGYSPYRDMLASEPQPVYRIHSEGGELHESSENDKYRAEKNARNTYPLLPRKQQGEYTAADRESLPGDVRTELIDGVLFDMASPKAVHQITLMNLSNQLFNQIEKCGRDYMVFVAPSDVWLTGDDKNIFQPDIYVLCDYTMIGQDGYTRGAPPFIIEILSPSTRSKDLLLKSYKYHAAGVREYWIVDPENRQVTVYDYDRDPDGTVNSWHTFEETVPVGISGGTCAVDFSIIKEALEKVGM